MSGTFRYRQLRQHGDDLSVQPWREEPRRGSLPFVEERSSVREGRPQRVESTDGTATLAELREMRAIGLLMPGDLVDVGRGWETAADCVELDAEPAPAPRRWPLVVGLAAFAIAVFLLARLG